MPLIAIDRPIIIHSGSTRIYACMHEVAYDRDTCIVVQLYFAKSRRLFLTGDDMFCHCSRESRPGLVSTWLAFSHD